MLIYLIALLLLNSCSTYRINKKPQTTVIDKTIREDAQYYSLTINYPQFINGPSQLNIDIAKYINRELEEFKASAIEAYNSTEQLRKNNEHQSISNIEIKYEIKQTSDSYISLVFCILGYHAYCAHPYFEYLSFNWDIKKNKYIILADLFRENFNLAERISILARQKITEINPDNIFEKEINLAPFTFNNDTINLYFDWPCFHIGEISFSREEINNK